MKQCCSKSGRICAKLDKYLCDFKGVDKKRFTRSAQLPMMDFMRKIIRLFEQPFVRFVVILLHLPYELFKAQMLMLILIFLSHNYIEEVSVFIVLVWIEKERQAQHDD